MGKEIDIGGYKRIPKEIKSEVLARVKTGSKVLDLAKEYGISTKTIYNWLSVGVKKRISHLAYSKLKRERDDLLKIVDNLTLEVEK